MRLLIAFALVATVALVPAAQAHQCSGADCGPCVKGENHQHSDSSGSCQSGPGFIQDAGYDGASQSVPFVGLVAALATLGLAALLRARA
jgi:hypothetical protein